MINLESVIQICWEENFEHVQKFSPRFLVGERSFIGRGAVGYVGEHSGTRQFIIVRKSFSRVIHQSLIGLLAVLRLFAVGNRSIWSVLCRFHFQLKFHVCKGLSVVSLLQFRLQSPDTKPILFNNPDQGTFVGRMLADYAEFRSFLSVTGRLCQCDWGIKLTMI